MLLVVRGHFLLFMSRYYLSSDTLLSIIMIIDRFCCLYRSNAMCRRSHGTFVIILKFRKLSIAFSRQCDFTINAPPFEECAKHSNDFIDLCENDPAIRIKSTYTHQYREHRNIFTCWILNSEIQSSWSYSLTIKTDENEKATQSTKKWKSGSKTRRRRDGMMP